MATLQSIRNRGGLLVFIIGFALLAFIVGDALTSGSSIFNADKNSAGEIAGESISIVDFQQLLYQDEELAKMNMGSSSLTSEQTTAIRNNTWQQLVIEKLMSKEYEEIGLTVSEEELYDLLLGDNMSPMISQMFADPTTGQVDKAQVRTVIQQLINAPASSSQKAYWLNIEKQISAATKMEKYNTLLAKSLFVTDEQAETFSSTANTFDISYIVKNYTTVSDSAVKVSKSEIEDYYNTNIERFQQEESRQIAYVNFDIEPSGKDFVETEEEVKDLIAEFKDEKDALRFVNLSSDTKSDDAFYKVDEIENDSLASFLFNNEGVFGPYLEEGSYKISRVARVEMLPDSVRARHILIPSQNVGIEAATAVADSLVTLLNKGADFEKLARENSQDQGSAINGGDLGWFSQRAMVKEFSDVAFFAKVKEYNVVASQFGVHIIQVTSRAKEEKKIQIATVAKEVVPSNETINNIYNKARTFAMNLETTEDFNKKVEEMGLTKKLANVDKNETSLSGLSEAREMIRNIYLAEDLGVVKDNQEQIVFDNADAYTIATILSVNEKGNANVESVEGQIRLILAQKKKADIISKEMNSYLSQSKSILSVSQKANAEVQDAEGVSFSSFQLIGQGVEPRVIAAATCLKEGEISAPIAGNRGVFVLSVNKVNNATPTKEEIAQSRAALQQTSMYRVSYQAMQEIIENGDVKDLRYRFY